VIIRATPLTSGPVTGYQEKLYRWNGDPSRREVPPPPATTADGTPLPDSTARMLKKYRVYCGHRDAGKTIAEARELTGVATETAYTYERRRVGGPVRKDPAAGDPVPPGRGARRAAPEPPPGQAPPSGSLPPGPAAGPSDPSGAVPDADGTAPDGSTDAGRAAQRDQWRRAQSAHNATQRAGRTKRAAKPTGPGMIRRTPPGGDAA
jgi:hypothetical protein